MQSNTFNTTITMHLLTDETTAIIASSHADFKLLFTVKPELIVQAK